MISLQYFVIFPDRVDSGRLDEDCHARFLKINAAFVIEEQGSVTGVLLVTPNAIMFDPNVSDPLVLQHGAEKYGAIIPMENILSAAIYSEIVPRAVRKTSRVESIPFSSLLAHHHQPSVEEEAEKQRNSSSSSQPPPLPDDVPEENESPEEVLMEESNNEEIITADIATASATAVNDPLPSPGPTRRVSTRSGTFSSGEFGLLGLEFGE